MVEGHQEILTVMFADVAGSTRLYDQLGDVKAEERISWVVALMVAVVERHEGALIKTIGDEIMCRFGDPSSALLAACEIQQTLREKAGADDDHLKVRIGLQHGKSIVKEGDLFGDTVNVAARMAGLALADQIITTAECVDAAQRAPVASRRINALYVKGKEAPIEVHEVLWQPDDGELTTLFSSPVKEAPKREHLALALLYLGKSFRLGGETSVLNIGRGSACDVEVSSRAASRVHAKLEILRDKIVLVDQSTNGTFVTLDSGEALFIHKEALPLTRSGVISLGVPSEEGAEHLISFHCEY